MESLIEQYLSGGILAFVLVFARIGAALTIMPGIGDSFTPTRIRLHIAVALSFILAPAVYQYIPDNLTLGPQAMILIIMEFIVGLFIGSIARILMTALDTAGMAISMMSGLGNAQLFNPALATQGSLVGAVLSVAGVILVFASNLHHLLLTGLIESYQLFQIGTIPQTEGMADMVAKYVSQSFLIGVQIAAPFMIIGMIIFIGMGVLARLMPQIQIFLVTLPLQIMLSFLTLSLILSAAFMFWLSRFEDGMIFFLSTANGG